MGSVLLRVGRHSTILVEARDVPFAIWLIVAFPAILKIAFALAEEGWQLWKQLLRQLFRSKGPDSTS